MPVFYRTTKVSWTFQLHRAGSIDKDTNEKKQRAKTDCAPSDKRVNGSEQSGDLPFVGVRGLRYAIQNPSYKDDDD
jgi:hypothetical protein